MSHTAQIVWWLEQIEAARRAVAEARAERRQPRRPGVLDEDVRARRARVAPLPKTPPAHDIIRGATITGERDEERARSMPAAGGGGGAGPGAAPLRGAPSPISGGFGASGAGMSSAGTGQGGPLGRARQLAAGYQPAVIKVVSYARGVTRATATGQYVQREDVPLETHDGRLLTDREAVADEIKAWSRDFSKRAESQDVGVYPSPEPAIQRHGRSLRAHHQARLRQGQSDAISRNRHASAASMVRPLQPASPAQGAGIPFAARVHRRPFNQGGRVRTLRGNNTVYGCSRLFETPGLMISAAPDYGAMSLLPNRWTKPFGITMTG